MNVAIGKGAYCAENTNTADKLKGKLAEGATSVILAATVLYPTTVDGTTTWNAADLVRYSGVLYTESHFKNYVLNNLKRSTNSTTGKRPAKTNMSKSVQAISNIRMQTA